MVAIFKSSLQNLSPLPKPTTRLKVKFTDLAISRTYVLCEIQSLVVSGHHSCQASTPGDNN